MHGEDVRSLAWIVVGIPLVVVLSVVAVISYNRRTAGQAEVMTATNFVAAATARNDRRTLENESALKDHPEAISWLLQRRSIVGERYRVYVCPNGEARYGYPLLAPQSVTHLGAIQARSGDVLLGFKFDRENARLEFVTTAFVSHTPSVAGE